MSVQLEETTDRSALEMEYNALRDEILIRINLRQKLLEISLILVGAFLGFFAKNPEYRSATLAYPPLAALLAVAWVQDDYGIRYASQYIREYIEKEIPTLRWEHYKNELRKNGKRHNLILLSHLFIIITTQIAAVAIGISVYIEEWYMPILAFLELSSIFIVICLCIDWWRSGKSITDKSRAILKKIIREMQYGTSATKTIEYRDVDYETAKKEVMGYIQENKEAYPSDIEEYLKLDYKLICQIVEELKREGRLRVL